MKIFKAFSALYMTRGHIIYKYRVRRSALNPPYNLFIRLNPRNAVRGDSATLFFLAKYIYIYIFYRNNENTKTFNVSNSNYFWDIEELENCRNTYIYIYNISTS